MQCLSIAGDGGALVLISPYSWLEEYTPASEWVGGAADGSSGDPDCFVELSARMKALQLELIHQEDVPFLIREHERKYQFGVSDCTIWKKKK
jgi:hypothetical protein